MDAYPSDNPELNGKTENVENDRISISSSAEDCPPHLVLRKEPMNFHRSGKLEAVQAVVLAAGLGSRLTSLVTTTPKCRLPIATIPMIYYPLYMLQKAGFTHCDVVVSSGSEAWVTTMAQHYGLTINLKLHVVDPTKDAGTLDAIRHFAPHLWEETDDVIIVSSDIISDLNIGDMLLSHRLKGGALTMLTAKHDTSVYATTPGLKQKSTIGPDILMHNMYKGNLALSVCGGDYEDYISIPSQLQNDGTLYTTMDITDQHLYIIKKRILVHYILGENSPCDSMTSLKAEVIPHLIAMQYNRRTDPAYISVTATNTTTELDPFRTLLLKFNTSTTRGGSHCPLAEVGSACHSYQYDSGFCLRANTIPAYWHLNAQLPSILDKLWPDCPVKVDDRSNCDVQPKAVLKGSNLLGSDCCLQDRITVTDCTVGRDCSISTHCRLTNCVLMDGVHVAAGCVLDNCLVCCTIETEKCSLKSCVVASARALHPGKTFTNETMEDTQFFSA